MPKNFQMSVSIPKTNTALMALLKADFAVLRANRRSAILALLVPVVILISWKPLIPKLGGAYALSAAITFGLMAIGLMGYSITVARDRDKGIFQRLRVAPVPTWAIMVSRLAIQLFMIMLLTILIFIIGKSYDGVTLTLAGYVITFFVAFLGGAVYLSLGQLIVGLIKNPETVNATTRIVYFIFIMVGMFGELGTLGEQVKKYIHYSPYGAVKMMLATSMTPQTWSSATSVAVLISIGYVLLFAGVGIKLFKWNTK